VAAATAGCDVGDPSTQPVDAPSLHLVSVLATTDLDDDFHPVRTPIGQDGAMPVLPTASFVLKFDRFLLPSSAIRQSVCIQSDLGTDVRTYDDCENGISLEPSYDPIRREVIYRRKLDEPRLAVDTQYRLTVLPPAEGTGPAGFRAFDGAPLEAKVQIDFSTVAQEPPGASDELPPGGDLFCARDPECLSMCAGDAGCQAACAKIGAEPLITDCGNGASCHRTVYDSATKELMRAAAEGLDLYSVAAIQATAVGKVAHQTQTGGRADDPDESPLRFGRAMPIIDPGNPGNSYLLYKIAVGPNVLEDAAAAEEIQRLRAGLVVGLPMPPYSGPDPASNATFTIAGADLLSAWIAQGAPTRDCSQPPFD
jgi:hypothetical protein